MLEADGKSPDTRHPKPGTRPKGGESKRSADKSRGMPVLRSGLLRRMEGVHKSTP
jgi:hypothetical protein